MYGWRLALQWHSMIGESTSLVGVLVLLLAGGLVGCGGTKPVQLPPQSLNQAVERGYGDDTIAAAEGEDAGEVVAAESTATEGEENQENQENSESKVPVGEVATAAPQPSASSAEERQPRDRTLVIIGEEDDDAAEAANPLLAASMAERRRRRTAPAAVAVINDKNLAEYAEGGHLTYSDTTAASGAGAQSEEEVAAEQARAEEELYWRTRVRSLRTQWRENADLVTELEQRAEGLRRDFYAEDDPYVRDRRIKPEWDRTLDRLDEARRGVERSREDLLTALEEGRRAGALPGWLRDGLELEPTSVVEEEMPEVDPEEPKVVDP